MSQKLLETLSTFINEERGRYETEHNNIFAFSVGQIVRYYQFTLITFDKYQKANKNFMEIIETQKQSFKEGSGVISKEQMELLNKSAEITLYLHLEIESFYQFAKILLDKIANAIELYFGQVRKKPLDSHDDMAKNFDAYTGEKKLKKILKLDELIKKLKKDISDYRDYKISHQKSPRVIKATVFAGGKTRMSITKIYPSEEEQQELREDLETKFLDELKLDLETYIEYVIEFIKTNKAKTNLRLEAKQKM